MCAVKYIYCVAFIFFSMWYLQLSRVLASSFLRLRDHTQGHTTVGRTHLDEWSARRRDLYLTTRNTYNRQISQAGFEPAIPVGERPQTHALDRSATGIACISFFTWINLRMIKFLYRAWILWKNANLHYRVTHIFLYHYKLTSTLTRFNSVFPQPTSN